MKPELLALYWAITKKYPDLLIGSEFVVTDYNPLSYLRSSAKLGTAEMRWVAELAQFNFTIKYRSGHSDKSADALSQKCSHNDCTTAELEEAISTPIDQVGTFLPGLLHALVEEAKMEPLLDGSHVRDPVLALSAMSTIPSIAKETCLLCTWEMKLLAGFGTFGNQDNL